MSKDVPTILYKKMRFLPIKVIFQVLLGMQHLLLCSEPLKFLNEFHVEFFQRLIDQCTHKQSSKIYSSTKFYQNVIDFNRRSAYVDILRNKTERSILRKIRLSAHNLAIERGGT
jgi:hypothetical protein